MSKEKTSPHKSFKNHIPEDARQHIKAARQEMRDGFEALVPPEFIAHRQAARREMLMAVRGLIDSALERTQ
ncbi:MAG: hypothetical protein U9Q82_03015 [Chloroflexota bacterium]|nr:hypothetical protein [Chloroflexota bacterium]